MHFIQKHVLKLLSTHKAQRYSELKMPRIDSNKFSYHLHKLIAQGYVKRALNGYALTTEGVHYCGRLTFHDTEIRIQPKIVTLMVCKNNVGEYLVYERQKLPFIDMIGFPYGKVHVSESIQKAAEREIKEKTGFEATLVQKGILYLLVTDTADTVLTHMLCHIYFGTSPRKVATPDEPFNRVFWMKEKDLLAANCMPGVADVLRIATSKKNGLQFEELSFVHE